MRLETAPTGPGENIELPIYFLKPHENRPTEILTMLGFTQSIYRWVLLNNRIFIVVDRVPFLIVQPNLQSTPVGNERITDFTVLDKRFPMSQS